ncbi:hypothetical protein ASH02_24175 [Nocardioides sp. Soil796]|nr:hypothetical protein ASH02_24175 [Nocardioides sp. Soil796]
MWVTGVHPEAVGSYGPEALAWMTENLKERGKPLSLRWWQRLAVVLQLQHREDGTLCFRTILESGPRRIGKSVRLRAMALWRLENGPDLFEPEQLVLHTGKDLAIVREVMRKAWAWAGPRDDWSCKKGMTEPEVSYADVNRWVARSKDATTGYDACLALVDEAWDVKPASIDDDLEPTMLERESPQLVLTSTAHRRATSLMRGRILDALSVDDGETLVLIWGAPVGSDPADPAVWRAASPHWSDDRASMMSSKFAKAMAGETDPEFDDPDPMEGFKAQYLNMWRLRDRHVEHGSAVFTADQWETLTALLPDTRPDSAAVESWHAEGVSVALAWRSGLDTATVQVLDFPDTASAVAALKDSGFRGRATVGASLLEDPAFKNVRTTKGQGRPAASVQELARLVAEGQAMHDGGEHLTTQVLAARTTPGADGPRLVSKARGDAIKAAVWALTSARKARSGRPRILLPSSV